MALYQRKEKKTRKNIIIRKRYKYKRYNLYALYIQMQKEAKTKYIILLGFFFVKQIDYI